MGSYWVSNAATDAPGHRHRQCWINIHCFGLISSRNATFLYYSYIILYIFIYVLYPIIYNNKANLRDLIAATGLVIWNWIQIVDFSGRVTLKLDGWAKKNNRALLVYYVKLCASFQIHQWIQTGVTVRKRSIRVKIGDFLCRVTLKLDEWPWKTIGHLFYTTLSFVHDFKAMDEFWLE